MFNVGNPEILQIAEAVAREKVIPKESILESMEYAIQVAGRKKYGHRNNIKAEINRKTGEVKLFRLFEVVSSIEEVENSFSQISLFDAKERDHNIKVGEFILEELPPIDLGRVAAQAAKHVIIQKVRDVEREKQYEEFISKKGQIINVIVKRTEYGNIIVDVGRDEAILPRNKVIPSESFRTNDRVRVLVENVRRSYNGPQIFLSRTDDEFLAKLFEQEVPEIYDRIIEIKAVSREPGSKSKIAVYSGDDSIDAVGSCVGIRGARVQAVSNELHGEKIDVIQWSSDPATFLMRALSPCEVSKVVIDEENHRIEAVVPQEHLSLAIGKKGQNVRLASKLIGWRVDILTEEEESKRRSEEFIYNTKLFMDALDVEEVVAQLLVVEGFTSVEELTYVSKEELCNIEGFEEELVNELISRALMFVEKKNSGLVRKIEELGVEESLVKLLDLDLHKILKLAEHGIKTMEDLADLNVREFNQILPDSGYNRTQIEKFIEFAKENN